MTRGRGNFSHARRASIGFMPDPSTAPADDALQRALETVDSFDAANVAVGLVGPAGLVAAHGDPDRRFRWASITKLVTGLAVLTAVDEGRIDLDEAAPGPAPVGATVRHLLAHSSGLAFDGDMVQGRPGTRRIYSNTGFDLLGALVSSRDGVPFEAALRARVLEPLGMAGTVLLDRPSQGLHGPLRDLVRLSVELLRPTLIGAALFDVATHVVLQALPGVLPGVGKFEALDWGLAFELRDGKSPHWTGTRNSPATFGHFGGSGTFLWVDPALDRALICLTDRDFGPWALTTWPAYSDGVIGALQA